MNKNTLIVTRNLDAKRDDRNAPKFGARHFDEKTQTPRHNIVLRGVEFIYTQEDRRFSYEAGFGCGLVAAGSVVGSAVSEEVGELQEINFDGHSFCTKNSEAVKTARLVVFSPHGIFAAL